MHNNRWTKLVFPRTVVNFKPRKHSTSSCRFLPPPRTHTHTHTQTNKQTNPDSDVTYSASSPTNPVRKKMNPGSSGCTNAFTTSDLMVMTTQSRASISAACSRRNRSAGSVDLAWSRCSVLLAPSQTWVVAASVQNIVSSTRIVEQQSEKKNRDHPPSS